MTLVLLILGVAPGGARAAVSDTDVRTSYEKRIAGAAEIGGGIDISGDRTTHLLLGNRAARPKGREAAGAVFAVEVSIEQRRIHLRDRSFQGFVVAGAAAGDGLSSACAADVNGDGIGDVIAGAGGADTPNGADSGAAYVVFGDDAGTDVDLADFHEDDQGGRGFRVDGGAPSDRAGADVGCVGDVNGDGLGDFVVAAPAAGSSYVVFGKSDPERVDLMRFDLNTQGPSGFRIDTSISRPRGAYAVAGGGDTNGDGRPDVLVGVVDRPEQSTGIVYVVFGKADPAPVEADGPDAVADAYGYTIHGQGSGWMTGAALASVGDANGDGLDDVVIGASRRTSYQRAGRAYVVFGAEEAEDVFLGDLGERGFMMVGGPGRDATGSSVSSVGDVDGDGLDDVVVGAPLTRVRAARGAGAAYVVFGSRRTATVALRDLGRRGYRLVGNSARENIGGSVGAYSPRGRTRVVVGGYRRSTTYVVKARAPR
ncbi:MAG: integrin alpha [Actinomycetota bacterium]|nr:integrin alpha [Actinomycetota bacterium]